MRRGSRYLVGVALVAFVAACRPAFADERPEVGELGRYLGYTIQCGCVQGDPDWVATLYYALFAERYGESYATAMSGFMKHAMSMEWDNQMQICTRVCGMDLTDTLRQLVAGVDEMMQSPDFRRFFDSPPDQLLAAQQTEGAKTMEDLLERDSSDRWSSTICRVSPARPECRTTGD